MIKAVIFDMDGLMFDTESIYSVIQETMASRRGKVFDLEFKRTLMGKRTPDVMEALNEYWGLNENVDELLKELDIELITTYEKSAVKMPGLDELLSFLADMNIRTCIGTSSRKFLVDILLTKHSLTDRFEFIVSGDMVENGKPSPDIYLKCLEQLELTGPECLVLEDSLNGIKAGKGAGCITCAIPSVFTEGEDFSVADLVVSDLNAEEIKFYLNSNVAQ